MRREEVATQLGERIRAARRLAGLSQRELARRAGVSAMAISKYENGRMLPGSGMLLRLAEALGVEIEFFLRPTRGRIHVLAFRRHPKLPATELKRAEAAAAEWLERYREVEELAKDALPADQHLASPVEVTSLEGVEHTANALRRAWGLGDGPIPSMVSLLEEHGIRVGSIDLPPQVEALAFGADDGSYAIVYRHGVPGDRQRFSLAHDLGHLVLRCAGGLDEEAACHRFAAAFLVPAAVARRELGYRRSGISLLELHDLKHAYGMSMAAWIKRARELRIVSERYARELLARFRREGWDRTEPGVQVPEERPRRMERLLMRLVEEGVIGPRRAGELLGQPWEKFVEQRSKGLGELCVAAGA